MPKKAGEETREMLGDMASDFAKRTDETVNEILDNSEKKIKTCGISMTGKRIQSNGADKTVHWVICILKRTVNQFSRTGALSRRRSPLKISMRYLGGSIKTVK